MDQCDVQRIDYPFEYGKSKFGFNYGEFDQIKSQSELNRFKIHVKEFVERTNAIGLQTRPGITVTMKLVHK